MKKQYVYNLENINLEEIGKLLKEGKLIIYPTDTVYGVGGIMESEDAIRGVYSAKQRNFSSPLIVLVSDPTKMDKIAYIEAYNREKIEKLIKKFWPGGLTIILKKKPCVPDIMTANGDTVGVRMPNLQTSLDIIQSVGGLFPTTSANISGKATPRSFEELSEVFKQRVDILVDGGKSPVGVASTIIDMSEKTPKIIRVGAISIKEIEDTIGQI
ncbi:Threonylcarbamoyl-AMP synthase [Fusobacterium sp. DD29]|uniref:L-threonylcarbamoyladenylate synthase n=1 Tax=unclassified Fusobacterium TaxID=2648384 RepID=UPI001B8D94A9|nr:MULTISPECIES: L-threonylcarbamoyladenylate synthase [unclassified Fusobacterium]MBR8700985.1 Threonylcarbamoyl-AMP synthase [Fusobacterium sp. DD45]MBR8710827.1 Threonylcarbamoyl-AMP synthase [Fusobacterium sp. DD28]MBR8748482.1 Threonylcarbamoyl-AMP synthase [Fusobacterium sp. DD29]MBR8751302.1 Threonylcarbamoyl-AMP synthase [Fusobacterium sp. DD26]MBR8760749.1 Threonylcarbamoyl-AMP synthase [Fusobacterium sp. DD25]